MSNPNSVRDSIEQQKGIHIVLCPFCKKRIPIIKVEFDERSNSLLFQCECSKEATMKLEKYLQSIQEYNKPEEAKCYNTEHGQQIAQQYCTNCRKWMCKQCLSMHITIVKTHIFRHRELNTFCGEPEPEPETSHNECLDNYCEDCKKTLCVKCIATHDKTHHVTQADKVDVELFEKNIQRITLTMEANERYKNLFDASIGTMMKSLENWKKDVNEAYSINKQKHIQLKQFCDYLVNTVKVISIDTNYALSKSITSLTASLNTDLQNTRTKLDINYKSYLRKYEEEISLKIGEITKIKTQISSVDNIPQLNQHTNQCLSTKEIERNLFALILLEDGRFVSGGNDNMIKLWKIDSFEFLNSFKAHFNWVTSLTQLQDGRLVSGGNDNMIKIWNIFTFECLKSFKAHSNWVTSITQLYDGRLVSGGNDNMIMLWNISTFECLNSFKSLSYEVTSLLQLQDGRLISGGIDNLIKFWDIATFHCLNSFKAHTSCVTSLIQLKDGKLVSGGNDKAIKIWNIETFECLNTFTASSVCVSSLILMPDGLATSLSSYNYIYFEFGETPKSDIQKWDF